MDSLAFTRNIVSHAIDLMRNFPVLAIIGARQTGKTTLTKAIAPAFEYFDLEKPTHFDQISRDPEFFFIQHPNHIIIDEAQEWPQLFNVLRGVVDEKRNTMGRFIITGSSSAELLSHISESLAGRIAIIELGTLKANEYQHTSLSSFYHLFEQKLTKENLVTGKAPLSVEQVQRSWLRGGYPEPLLKLNQSPNGKSRYENWMANYQATYINRDIARLFPKLNKINFRRFLTMLSKLSGTILNKSDLARALEVSEPTIRHYLEIAEGTFLWRQLTSFENNVTKSLVKLPKGHMRDSGLLHHLLRINSLDALYSDPIAGHSFEGFVIEEILKGLQDAGISNTQPYYYRTRSGAEIDLILEGNFGVLPIEIKLGRTISPKSLISLNKFIQEQQLPFGMIINQSEKVEWLTPTIIQVPAGWL
jgi:hypothetical protein